MTALERKEKTEAYLKGLDIPINPWLPVIEEEADTIVRTAEDIAKRIIILLYLGGYAEDGDRKEIIDFLQAESLWDSVSDYEKELLSKRRLTEKDKIKISWQSENIYLLLWAINKIDLLDLPIEHCNIGEMFDLLPGPFEPTQDYIQNATVRSKPEILDKSDLIYRLHWAAREANLRNQDIPGDIDIEILQEWHYAINWVTYYNDDWDDIQTDT